MITKEELIEKIEDLDFEDSKLAKFIKVDDQNTNAFDISFKANPDQVLNLSTADEGLLGTLNKRSRRQRQRHYEKKLRKPFKGIRIVSEGDSWFQYPVFLKDIIDNLNDNDMFAIYSLGYGGDWLSNIYREQEYLKAIRINQPKVFLFSGGGNDLAGKNRLATLVHSYNPSRNPTDYFNEEFDRFLADIKLLYKKIFDNLTSEFKNLKIICHGYDYAIPKNGHWLGKPLITRGIVDESLQQEILKLFIDKFNQQQIELAENYQNITHIDLRGTIIESSGWHDELHPNNHYFAKIASKIEEGILKSVGLI